MKKVLIISGAILLAGVTSASARTNLSLNAFIGGEPAYVEPQPVYVEQPAPAYVIAPSYERYNGHYDYRHDHGRHRWHDRRWHR